MADKTQNLPDTRSFEERVFARFDAMDARFDSMETRMAAMEKMLDIIQSGLGELYGDSIEVRARIALLERRERTPAG